MKKAYALIIAPIVLLLLSSYTPMVFDPTVPKQETVPVAFRGIRPQSYNGVPFSEKMKSKIVKYYLLPLGPAEIVYNVHHSENTGVVVELYEDTGYVLNYNLEAGKDYFFWFSVEKDEYGDPYFAIKVYNIKLGNKWPTDEHLIEIMRCKKIQAAP
jgi:hypothetical protein